MTPRLRRRLAGWHPERILMLARPGDLGPRHTPTWSIAATASHLSWWISSLDHHVEILAVLESG
jgi:hypothetical protein